VRAPGGATKRWRPQSKSPFVLTRGIHLWSVGALFWKDFMPRVNRPKDLEEIIDSVERSRKELLRMQCELEQIEEFVESLDGNQPQHSQVANLKPLVARRP
jgi:hypothetical protein